MDLCAVKYLLLLSVFTHLTSAASHSLWYFYTVITPRTNFPEFTLVCLVNGELSEYYDSNIKKQIPKNEWIKKIDAEDPYYWKRNTEITQGVQETFIHNIQTVKQHFNHTGVHTLQVMYGCELDDNETIRGDWQYGYDGEDYISLDLNNLTWTAAKPQAVITKQEWEARNEAKFRKSYLMNECISWLKKYVGYSSSHKVPPEVSLLQKDSSSPVVCHATGFYPKSVNITWQKNGEDLDEDVELRETLPNQDGTFQKRSILTVSPEELNKHNYTCIIQHSSLEKEMLLQVSDRRVMSGASDGGSVGVIIGAVVAFLLIVIVIVCAGVFIWKKKQSGFKPVSGNPNAPSEGDSSSNTS